LLVAYPYSRELTSCGTNSNGFKIYYNAYFIPPASFWELSLPLRSIGSSSVVFVSNGLAPLVCLLSSSSFKVFDSKIRNRG
jgi:hypothetical protein